MIPTNATQTPIPFQDASNSMATNFGMVPALLIVAVSLAAILAVTGHLAPILARSKILSKIANRFGQSLIYALKGTAATVVFGAIAAPIWYIATLDASARDLALQWVGYAISAYIALVGLGWLADWATTRFIDAHPDWEEWADILPDSPESGEEVAADGGERHE